MMKLKRIMAGAMICMLGIAQVLPAVGESSYVEDNHSDGIQTGTCGENVTWEFDSSTGTLTIMGSGEIKDYYRFDITGNIESVILKEGITRIGIDAFARCSSLATIELPESLTNIDTGAFEGCNNLASIELPEGITSIGNSAFRNCSNLVSIKLSEGITSIGNYAFEGCNGLTSIELPKSLININYGTFKGCNGLVSIKLPEGITKIGAYAFAGCSSLATIELPESLTNIDTGAFEGCNNLASIELPEGVTKIGASAFFDCSGLTEIIIPKGVTDIYWYTFSGCSNLVSINLPTSLTTITESVFSGCSSLPNIELPESVTKIEGFAFADCSSLTSIELPEGVTEIERGAFENCSSLTNIKLPKSTIYIGTNIFLGCSNINKIENYSEILLDLNQFGGVWYNEEGKLIPKDNFVLGKGIAFSEFKEATEATSDSETPSKEDETTSNSQTTPKEDEETSFDNNTTNIDDIHNNFAVLEQDALEVQKTAVLEGLEAAKLPNNITLKIASVLENDAAFDFIEKNLKDKNVAVVDLSLVDANGTKIEQQPDGKIKITMSLFENIKDAEWIEIFRYDETNNTFISLGVSQVKNGKITFEADHFTPYIFASVNAPENTTEPDNKGNVTDTSEKPKTGDTAHTAVFLCLAVASLAGFAVTLKRRKA
ncbi:MAG: leucine-rich repeat domain-containing protein [Lachnospiraceae bacterium]|nr:leucine-rich repeat domain-containing protein [Lachnospiraceae bacterium]